jgi:isopenicillin N synthase-like dioxygenase
MDEIEEFCNYLTKSVNRRLLTLFSRVLELPDDHLWDNVQSHGSPTGEGYFRHALFRPVQKDTQEASKGLRMHGHTDFGLTTLLFSVPISCLQIWGQDEQWYYVPYKPGALVVNIGDTLEIVSGGHFKATKHRVYKPPVDQLHQERLSLVLFNSSVGDMPMGPAYGESIDQAKHSIACAHHFFQNHRLSKERAASKSKASTKSSRIALPQAKGLPPTANGVRSRLLPLRTRRIRCTTELEFTRLLSTASSCTRENTWA